ncbi:hypothetical protein H1O16_gp075 [Burkholderia phage BcepSaruman]|uniref:Uncharacterized protein n=1 Tax=Burkholderia phage BcepSaruman TaxID=2530032 RepID=A0A4D5ZHF1_9CAUD|nr:hypothetical protein H1O16_gp075 [Burkholderia phage BcepSaruman]QBX06488.1 hypothetical protein BcepSaruman_075 [Burkholderia phage BcepSaruman]
MTTITAKHRLVESATWFDSLSDFQKREYLKEHPHSKYAQGFHPGAKPDERDVELESDEHDPVAVETLSSKIRGWFVEALGGTPKRVFYNKNGLPSGAEFKLTDGSKRKVKFKYTQAMLNSKQQFSPYGYWKDKSTYVYMPEKEWKSLTPEQRRSAEDRKRAYGSDFALAETTKTDYKPRVPKRKPVKRSRVRSGLETDDENGSTNMQAVARLLVTAKGEDWWGNMTPEQRQKYTETHPNSQHSDTYDPKDEWWEFMTPEMRQRYVKEHPKSKYAQEYGQGHGVGVQDKETKRERENPRPATPAPTIAPSRPAGSTPTHGPGPASAPYSPRGDRAGVAMTRLAREAQAFIANGGTAPGSEDRVNAAGHLRAHSGNLAKAIMHDMPDANGKIAALRRAAVEQSGGQDAAARIMAELLQSSSMREAIEKLGPVGALLFMALQYLGPERLWTIAHSALAGLDEAESGMGYFKCEWVPVSQQEWHELLKREIDELGVDGARQSATVTAALRLIDIDIPGQSGQGLTNKSAGTESNVEALNSLIEALADYAASGDIPAEAWDAAIEAVAKQDEAKQKAPEAI